MTTLLVVAGALISVEGAAVGLLLGLVLSWLLNVTRLEKTTGMAAKPFYFNGGRFFVAGIVTTVATVGLSQYIPLPMGFVLLVLEALSATLLFWGLVAMSPAGRRDISQGLLALKLLRH